MRKGLLFEAAAGLLLALLALLAYLMVTSPAGMAPAGSAQSGGWTLSGMMGDASMLEYYNYFTSDDGTIYTVDGKSIHAIGPDGRVLWNLSIPDLTGDPGARAWYSCDAKTDNDTLYVTLRSPDTGPDELSELLAISPEGKLLLGINGSPAWYVAKNDRLYACQKNITAYENDGTVAWTIVNDATDPPLLDDTGTMYFIKGLDEGSLCVYGPDGRLKTTYNLTEYGLGHLASTFCFCPQIYYNNHTVYVPLERGLVALSDGGAFKWKKAYSNEDASLAFWNEMFDKNGNIYLQGSSNRDVSRISYMTPDGDERLLTDKYDPYWCNTPSGIGLASVEDGVFYTIRTVSATTGTFTSGYEVAIDPMTWHTPKPDSRSIGLLDTCRVTAYDLKTGKPRWNITLPMDEQTTNVTKNRGSPGPVRSYSIASGMLSNGTLYVRYWSNNTELAGDAGIAEYVYAGGMCAINKDGSLAWYKPTSSRVLRMEAWNGSIIYCGADGRISAFRPRSSA